MTKVSVILTSYDKERYADLKESIKSILDQSYKEFEVIVIVEQNDFIYDKLQNEFEDSKLKPKLINENMNLAEARNRGVNLSNGDLIVFTDDDIIADKDWLSELVFSYEDNNVSGVGGYCDPIWCEGAKSFMIPEEYYWLVGATHNIHPKEGLVRNTFGCNIGFNRKAFLRVGGMNSDLGKDHGSKLQGEETEVSSRIFRETGERIYYNPRAKISHKVYAKQTSIKYLLSRAFWQGVTKNVMSNLVEDSINEEKSFLKKLFTKGVPKYVKNILSFKNTFQNIVQLLMLFILTLFVGLGFLYGFIYR